MCPIFASFHVLALALRRRTAYLLGDPNTCALVGRRESRHPRVARPKWYDGVLRSWTAVRDAGGPPISTAGAYATHFHPVTVFSREEYFSRHPARGVLCRVEWRDRVFHCAGFWEGRGRLVSRNETGERHHLSSEKRRRREGRWKSEKTEGGWCRAQVLGDGRGGAGKTRKRAKAKTAEAAGTPLARSSSGCNGEKEARLASVSSVASFFLLFSRFPFARPLCRCRLRCIAGGRRSRLRGRLQRLLFVVRFTCSPSAGIQSRFSSPFLSARLFVLCFPRSPALAVSPLSGASGRDECGRLR